jgi:hypothetical protein
VTHIEASLNYPTDLRILIQNLTRMEYGVVVEPSEQASFAYFFRPERMLEPMKFGLLARVYYYDEDMVNYTTVFFNNTVFLEEEESTFDTKTLFTYVLGLAVIGLIAYLGYNKFIAKKISKGRKYVEMGTEEKRPRVDHNEWLVGTNVMPFVSPKANIRKRKA